MPDNLSTPNISSTELEICLKVLQQISEDSILIDHHDRLKSLIAKIYKESRKKAKQLQRTQQKIRGTYPHSSN